MIVGDRECKWLVKGTHKDTSDGGIILYHSDKAGLTVNADGATLYDTIGDAMRKAIYRNGRSSNGFVFRVERIDSTDSNKNRGRL